MIRWLIFTFLLLLQISSVETITCYTCIDCGDPFNANSLNVTLSPSSCYYCYKLTVWMAYAPVNYVVKECVQTCTESSGIFGGASIEVNCCTSSMCNDGSMIKSRFPFVGTMVFSVIFFFRNL